MLLEHHVCERTGLSRSELDALVRAGAFPKPRRSRNGVHRLWTVDDIEAWRRRKEWVERMRTLFVAENDGMAEIDDALQEAREPYEVLARIRWARARGTLDESKVDLSERVHGLRVRRDRRSWHVCLMIAIERGDCLREHGAIDWAAVREWLGPCPDLERKRRRGAPRASPEKKRLLAEAVEILKTRGGYSLNDACSIVAEVVRFTRRVRNPARTIEEAWREYERGKPTADGRRWYRYPLIGRGREFVGGVGSARRTQRRRARASNRDLTEKNP